MFEDLRRKYGDIFGFWNGTRRGVVVSSFDLIQVCFLTLNKRVFR